MESVTDDLLNLFAYLFMLMHFSILWQVEVGHVEIIWKKAVNGLFHWDDAGFERHERLFEGQDSSQHRVRRVAYCLLQQDVQNWFDQAKVSVKFTRHSLKNKPFCIKINPLNIP